MRRIAAPLIVLLAGGVTTAPIAAQAPATEPDAVTIPAEPPGGTAYQRVKKLLPPHVGCAVMVVGRDAEGQAVEFKQGYGVAGGSSQDGAGGGVGGERPVTATTNFRVGSFTKVLTAAGVLLLADEGKLSLDDPVTDWLPTMPAYAQQVTIRRLLDHTSGVPRYQDLMNEPRTPDASDVTVLRLIARRTPPNFPAGSQCDYSDSGYVLLGLIAQQASGRPFHDFLREAILQPAGMETSAVFVEGLTRIADRAVGFHHGSGPQAQAQQRQLQQMIRMRDRLIQQGNQNNLAAFEQRIAALQRQAAAQRAGPKGEIPWHEQDQSASTRLRGDGALYASLNDLQALLNAVEERRLPLSEASYRLWLEPQAEPTGGDRLADGARGRRYACGWIVDERLGETRYSHRGSKRGFCQTIQWLPESDRVVAILMNCRPPGAAGPLGWEDALIEQLGERVLQAVLQPQEAVTGFSELGEPTELND